MRKWKGRRGGGGRRGGWWVLGEVVKNGEGGVDDRVKVL